MGNIFKFEMKHHLKSVLLWLLGITLIQLMMMALFPTFANDSELVNKMLENYPEELLKGFGMDSAMSLSSITGFLVFAFSYVQLCLAIQSSYLGFSILSKEERALTADFLISKPVKRSSIISAKLLAALLSIFITLIFTFFITLISIELFKGDSTYDVKSIIWLFISMHFFQWLYLAIGLVISVSLKKIKNVMSFTLALSLGTYILNALKAIIGGDALGWFTPFYYFDLSYTLANNGFRTLEFLVSIALMTAAVLATYILYTRRNIASL